MAVVKNRGASGSGSGGRKGRKPMIPQPIKPKPKNRLRSNKKCPYPKCNGQGDERHIMKHTLRCNVAGCAAGNPWFSNAEALGNHLVVIHNNGNMKKCDWPNCSISGEKAKNNHKVHLRLHNFRINPVNTFLDIVVQHADNADADINSYYDAILDRMHVGRDKVAGQDADGMNLD
ncbi:hypothetical protein E8E14_008813 [Neopestalotiopsis sp. 37M]|nr:hypothetical protein E8E14_008813 [Neopestalotiopsis sp. 37M]